MVNPLPHSLCDAALCPGDELHAGSPPMASDHSRITGPTADGHGHTAWPAAGKDRHDELSSGSISLDGHSLPALVTELRAQNSQLAAKLDTLPVIEQAKGVVMARYGIDSDAAFALLRRWSSHTNVRVRDISHLVVTAVARPASFDAVRCSGVRDDALQRLIEQLHRGFAPPGLTASSRSTDHTRTPTPPAS